VSYEDVLRDAEADPNVIGVVLSGSRGKGALFTDESDWDVYVVVREPSGRRPTVHGAPVEVVEVTLMELRETAAWNRYSFAWVEPVLDKTRSGELARVVEAIARVDAATAAEPLDDYVNSLYRSLKNARLGLELASRLDAAESVPGFLSFLFAAHGRLRPYNKWLRWELEQHPLGDPRWAADALLPRLERIVATGDLREQHALFRDTESFARGRGLDAVIDGWEPDVHRFRGG
jgi:predicted nucleotidyltransferase